MGRQTARLIRLIFFLPHVEELRRRGIDTSGLLVAEGLKEDSLANSDLMVPANLMYRLAERAAEVVEDPFLGATMGMRYNLRNTVLCNGSGRAIGNISDIFLCFIDESAKHTSSQRYLLRVCKHRVKFRAERTFKPTTSVDQVDAWDIGAWVMLLKQLVGPHWSDSEITARLSNPNVIPAELLPRSSMKKGDNCGCEIAFPTEWMRLPVSTNEWRAKKPFEFVTPANSAEGIVEQLLEAVELPNVVLLKKAIVDCGVQPRSVQRLLKEVGTSFSKLIDDRKKTLALGALSNGVKMAKIAHDLGYSDQANFNHAFRRWTGQSPSEYREQNHGNA